MGNKWGIKNFELRILSKELFFICICRENVVPLQRKGRQTTNLVKELTNKIIIIKK